MVCLFLCGVPLQNSFYLCTPSSSDFVCLSFSSFPLHSIPLQQRTVLLIFVYFPLSGAGLTLLFVLASCGDPYLSCFENSHYHLGGVNPARISWMSMHRSSFAVVDMLGKRQLRVAVSLWPPISAPRALIPHHTFVPSHPHPVPSHLTTPTHSTCPPAKGRTLPYLKVNPLHSRPSLHKHRYYKKKEGDSPFNHEI